MYYATITEYWEIIMFYLPLGIIGVWRWAMWLIKKIISLLYVQPNGKYKATLSIITPVYNEDPSVFKQALKSWKKNKPNEIIAVIDHSNYGLIDQFREFADKFSGAKLIVTKKRGKRQALADGIRASESEIVALVDSDTIWSPKMKRKIVGPFADSEVGGLVTRQDVLETDSLAKKIFKMLLDDRYLLEYPFLSVASDALLCLSGRTAVYRRKAIEKHLGMLVNDTFLGKKMISGDDKTLTRLVQGDGWKTRYLRDVRVYTPGASKLSDFLLQKLRWTRNGLRSDFKVIFSAWVWKRHKVLAIHMLDKFISPIFLLIGPVYFGLAIYWGHYRVAIVIILWWIGSRTIKLFPHFREKPSDILILPAYIIMSLIMAVIKIYAMVTIDEQGWITRWDKKRLVSISLLKRSVSYLAVFMILSGLSFTIFCYQKNILLIDKYGRQKKKTIFTENMDRMTDFEIESYKNKISDVNSQDRYGYYVVLMGDTNSSIRQKFNLPNSSKIYDGATRKPLSIFSSISVGQTIAFPVEDLRNPMDKKVLSANLISRRPLITYEASTNTIYLKKGGSVANLSTIYQGLGFRNKELLYKGSGKEWILRANLYVSKEVTLILDGEEVENLKLRSDDEKFIWIRGESGNILITDTKITSWDEKKGAPDENHENGRAYITVKNNGRMDVINSDIGYLGYAGLPKRGGPFGGSYGISWKIKNGGFRKNMLTGVVTGSRFHNNYFGLYTYGTSGMLIQQNDFFNNIEYGLDPHDDSNNMLIKNNNSHNNGNHGIIISKRCFNNVIVNNISHDNRLHGIMLDRSSNNNLVLGNILYGNIDGVAIYGSNENLILENEIKNNITGIRANAKSSGNFFEKNKIINNSRGIYIYGKSKNNIAFDNSIKSNKTGLVIKESQHNIILKSINVGENVKDGNIIGESYGNNIQ